MVEILKDMLAHDRVILTWFVFVGVPCLVYSAVWFVRMVSGR